MSGDAAELIEDVEGTRTLNDVILDKIQCQKEEEIEDPFYIVDLNDVTKKFRQWKSLFPRVTPFYAVKCLDNSVVIDVLKDLGAGFDCASKNEITHVLNRGVSADRIIYAHPCKQKDMIVHAARVGVDLTTFDNEEELHKVKELFPCARLVLRILPPATKKVLTNLGNKFGCPPRRVKSLLAKAKSLGLTVVGVSFHVGFGCYDLETYAASVEVAARAFQIAAEVGFILNLLDIGGGFPGYPGCAATIEQIASVLVPALDKYFPEYKGTRIIAEPGTFFVASALHLVAQVIARRVDDPSDPESESGSDESLCKTIEYYLNDGIYGSFCRCVEGARVPPPIVPAHRATDELFKSTLFGPTCDGNDVLFENYLINELQIGDWLIFPYMGAYSISIACPFNGMPIPRLYFVRMANFDSSLKI